jgi:hypothetical protein
MNVRLQLVVGCCSCWMLASGCSTSPGPKAPLARLRDQASSGDPVAQCALGQAYEFGQGVSLNYAEAAQWYQCAAKQGNPVGQFRLGNCYQHGFGVATNLDRAIELFTQAAEKGLMEAQHRMGYLHDVGVGTASDMAAATSWYRLAAEQGCVDAMLQVGVSYSLGAGGPRDPRMAWMWLSLAQDFAVHEGDSKKHAKTAGLLADLECQITPTQIAEGRLKAERWRHEFLQRNQPANPVSAGLQSLKQRAN